MNATTPPPTVPPELPRCGWRGCRRRVPAEGMRCHHASHHGPLTPRDLAVARTGQVAELLAELAPGHHFTVDTSYRRADGNRPTVVSWSGGPSARQILSLLAVAGIAERDLVLGRNVTRRELFAVALLLRQQNRWSGTEHQRASLLAAAAHGRDDLTEVALLAAVSTRRAAALAKAPAGPGYGERGTAIAVVRILDATEGLDAAGVRAYAALAWTLQETGLDAPPRVVRLLLKQLLDRPQLRLFAQLYPSLHDAAMCVLLAREVTAEASG